MDEVINRPNSTVDNLFEIYKKQPILYQKILQIKALLYSMPTKGDFVDRISRTTLRGLDGRKFNFSNLNPILDKLQKQKLLTKDFNCAPTILHAIANEALGKSEIEAKDNLSILWHFFDYKSDYKFDKINSLHNSRIIHIMTHLNDPRIFLNANLIRPGTCILFAGELSNVFYSHSLDPDWIANRHSVIQLYFLCMKLYGFYGNISPLPPDVNLWIDFIQKNDCVEIAYKNNLDKIPVIMARILQLSFAFKEISYITRLPNLSPEQYYQYEVQGGMAFFKEDKINAVQYYGKANKSFKSLLDKHEWFRGNLHGIFYVLALLYQNSSAGDLRKVENVIVSMRTIRIHEAIIHILETLFFLKCNNRETAAFHHERAQSNIQRSPTVFPFLLALIDWCTTLLEPETLFQRINEYLEKFRYYHDISHLFTAQIYAELLQIADANNPEIQYFFNHLAPLGDFRFTKILSIKQPWEYAMDQLHHILTDVLPNRPVFDSNRRMVWIIDPDTLNIEVCEQSLRKDGSWGAGRPITLRRIYTKELKLDYLTPHDQKAITGLRRENNWYNLETFSWDKPRTLNALIGHPLVFHQKNRDIPIELVKGTVELQVEKTERGYHFSLSKYSTTPAVCLEKETTNRYRIIEISDDIAAICKILSEKGMTVPFQAKERVINMICNAKSSIHIQSDIADDNLPVIAGDITPYAHLFPIQDGIKINLWIKPLGHQGSYYRASHGQRSFIVTIENSQGEERQKIIRDFEKENQTIQSLISQCKTLAEFDEKTDEWYINTLEKSLELLLELDDYKKNYPLIIEWPKGQSLKVKQTVSSKNLSLSIRGSQYWFEYEGEVNIDNEHVLDIKKLLDLFSQSQGRFIPLNNGEFIALTEKFRKQLEELRTVSDGNKVYHLSTAGLRGLAEEVGTLHEDQAWAAHIKKLAAMEKYQPTIPSTLQAELREYQKEGFSYLSRLTHWEIGACLADDMGLGKTIQAIALLLSHASSGPCLVVAPTSVCFVWLEELAKFAPTLVPHTLYNTSDRMVLINSLNKMDVLICSYGLLHQVGDLLLDKAWQMVILDEAQAIKNSDTKRWKYATQLNSKCRIALTGTPIENHLGELWSIFRFLNPGLLGSLTFFQQRFSGPIEKYNDPITKRALKNLVSPYILRRTKSEVLLELPPKIEQSILIEPTAEEMAFYEAVRVKALERIKGLNQAEGKQKRFSILAEISRLRQACCHASLVDENINIPSSKIKTFITLVKNIIDNKHKVLIFSQFVRYLDKVKEVLNQEKINYQYLDGSTSLKDRQRAVDDFQRGVGDLFLISLKAGGTGLNLTAADYVIILDPWWNPAVEDQAADRAHRLGQSRPVTVYRLIVKNSIEEKIITLHKNKKDLAADLLSGSDMSGKISEEELMELITG